MWYQRSIPLGNTKNQPSWLSFSKIYTTWSFHVVVLQRTTMICTNITHVHGHCSAHLTVWRRSGCRCRRSLLKLHSFRRRKRFTLNFNCQIPAEHQRSQICFQQISFHERTSCGFGNLEKQNLIPLKYSYRSVSFVVFYAEFFYGDNLFKRKLLEL